MDLVDYIDLIFGDRGSEGYFVYYLSDILYAVVGSCVHLDYIKDGAV